MLAKLDRAKEALEAFDQALKLDEQFGAALFGKCKLIINLDGIDEARKVCSQLLENSTDEQKRRPEIAAPTQMCDLN